MTAPSRFLLPFRRVTSSGQYIGEVDGLRFVAILCVYLYHLFGDVLKHSPEAYKAPLEKSFFYLLALNLNIGVQLFFVISGFVLALPFASHFLRGGPNVSLKRYFVRRITRLEPPYVLSLLLFFALKIVAGRGLPGALLPHLGASLVYLHNLVYREPSVISIVAWSLEVEVQFYLLAPLFANAFRLRRPWTRRAGLIFGCIVFSAIDCLWGREALVRLSLVGNLQYFLIGILLADLYVVSGDKPERKRRWDAVAVGLCPILAVTLVSAEQWKGLLVPWIVCAAYQGVFRGVYVHRLLTNAWITVIGGMCYSIYLLHNYAVSAAGAYSEVVGSSWPVLIRVVLQFVVMTPLVLSVSALYYIVIERPCMRPDWPQRLAAWIGARRQSSGSVVVLNQASAD